jgi:hypothetical protein
VAAPIVADVIARHGRERTPELTKALRDAYPFGERRYWPYKAWLAEIKRQLGNPRDPDAHSGSLFA